MEALQAVDHDEACAQEVGKQLELGCFEEQLITYSTCYEHMGKRYYFISETAENAYLFAEKQLKDDIYCVPVARNRQWALVPSGKRADLMQQCKKEAGKALAVSGGGKIAEQIAALAPKNGHSAVQMLDEIEINLIGCFDESRLQIFEGLIDVAYYAKKISAVEYLQYGDWLKHVRETVEAESIEHAVHERTYCGFSYLDERGNIKYYHNAVKASALERQSELRKKKQLVTPMVAKRYCFNKVEMFDGVIEDFKNVLHKTYNEAYWNVLLQIYALPTMVDKNAFMKAYDAAIESGDKLLVDALQYYGVLWHVWELKRG